jgi:YD repeat-containing protein
MKVNYIQPFVIKVSLLILVILLPSLSYGLAVCANGGPTTRVYGSSPGEICSSIFPGFYLDSSGFCRREDGSVFGGCGYITCPAGEISDGVANRCASQNDIIKPLNFGIPKECPLGNPVNPHTGNKYQTEDDYFGTGSFGLIFRRYYNSDTSVRSSTLGQNWRSTYDKSIIEEDGVAEVIRADGKEIKFDDVSGSWEASSNVVETLEEIKDGQGQRIGWYLTTSNENIEEYSAAGRLLSITNRFGQTHSLNYELSSSNDGDDNPDTLDTVTDSFGRALLFTYDANNRVSGMTDPDGKTYSYVYDDNNNLSTVDYPNAVSGNNNSTRIYHYEDTNFIHALTGITDETGNRFASWGYNTEGKAIFSEHAGGAERIEFVYNGNGTTIVTDSLGNVQTYYAELIFGEIRTGHIVGGPCSSCGGNTQEKTFDSNGFVASRTDFNGNLTTFVHDARGLELSRTEAVGTPHERTITTEWHATFRLPTKITESGKITTFTYDAQGRLLERKEEAAP